MTADRRVGLGHPQTRPGPPKHPRAFPQRDSGIDGTMSRPVAAVEARRSRSLSVADDRCRYRRVGRKRGCAQSLVGTIPGILCGFPSMRNFKMGLFAETAPIPQRYPLLRYEIRALGRAKNPSFSPIYLPLTIHRRVNSGLTRARTRPTARRLRPTSP